MLLKWEGEAESWTFASFDLIPALPPMPIRKLSSPPPTTTSFYVSFHDVVVGGGCDGGSDGGGVCDFRAPLIIEDSRSFRSFVRLIAVFRTNLARDSSSAPDRRASGC